jgi:hypothetical protein
MKAGIRKKSLADQDAERRKSSVLLQYAYHYDIDSAWNSPKGAPPLAKLFVELVAVCKSYRQLTGYHLPVLTRIRKPHTTQHKTPKQTSSRVTRHLAQ